MNKFGNGLSSSPSNTPPPFDRARYPHFTMTDNVRVQQRLLAEVFGVERVKLVYGFSMGGMQAFHWARCSRTVDKIAPICGAAECSAHNFVFLEGVKAALTADPAWQDGWFATQPTRGFQAMGRVYAGWGSAKLSTARSCGAGSAFLPRGFSDRQLGGEFPPSRRQRSARDAVDLAVCRYQRQRALQRRF